MKWKGDFSSANIMHGILLNCVSRLACVSAKEATTQVTTCLIPFIGSVDNLKGAMQRRRYVSSGIPLCHPSPTTFTTKLWQRKFVTPTICYTAALLPNAQASCPPPQREESYFVQDNQAVVWFVQDNQAVVCVRAGQLVLNLVCHIDAVARVLRSS